ncbi:hypothetical protein G7046_g2466 [Stylonectria norvegica]|nr:hypothetical protein G7046_g2466 [Stylonectria norvegica]
MLPNLSPFFCLGFVAQILAVQAKDGVTTGSRYDTIHRMQNGGVVDVVFYNNSTEINMYDSKVQSDLYDFVNEVQIDTSVKVIVFRSGNPDFFFGHVELRARDGVPNFPTTDPRNEYVNAYGLFYNITELAIPTIAVIDGRARGAGNEFVLSCDMRFATKDSLFGQPEVALGFNPGAGATSNLPRLIGRGRALEYLLSGNDATGAEAERLGWINRSFHSGREMNDFVNKLAKRVALYPKAGVANIKSLVNIASRPQLEELAEEAQKYLTAAQSEEAQELTKKTLELSNDESRGWFELEAGKYLPKLYA